jgi:hypothetical protein
MTVAARDLQKDSSQIVALALVEICVVGGCFQSLLQF